MSLPSPWGDPLGSMRSAEPRLPAGTSPGLPVGFWDTGAVPGGCRGATCLLIWCGSCWAGGSPAHPSSGANPAAQTRVPTGVLRGARLPQGRAGSGQSGPRGLPHPTWWLGPRDAGQSIFLAPVRSRHTGQLCPHPDSATNVRPLRHPRFPPASGCPSACHPVLRRQGPVTPQTSPPLMTPAAKRDGDTVSTAH